MNVVSVVVAALAGLVLGLFEIVLIARLVLDWVGVLAPTGGGSTIRRAHTITHAMTEPIIAPVCRILRPIRIGSMSLDLAFTAVFLAVVVLRTFLSGV